MSGQNSRSFTLRLTRVFLTVGLISAVLFLGWRAVTVQAGPERSNTVTSVKGGSENLTVFSNPSAISPADRVSNNAGTDPGVPSSNYPSPIVVSGLTGTVSKVTVTLAITSTFPDDIDILLVGPTNAKSLVISDAGGSGDHTNVTYTFDQTAATAFPDGGTTVITPGTYKPANYLGLATPEPSGQDNFPGGGGLASYTADLGVFNGTNPNGTWNLYVVDDQVLDVNSLPGGWSIDITTAGGTPSDANVDFNGDGKTDWVVARGTSNPGLSESSGVPQMSVAPYDPDVRRTPGTLVRSRKASESNLLAPPIYWYTQYNGVPGGGIGPLGDAATDFLTPEDFDGDGKDDPAVWTPGAPLSANFKIFQTSTNTVRTEIFGQDGDDPAIVGDYDGDNKADPAVFRCPAQGAGDGQCFFFFKGSNNNPSGNITYVPWGFGEDGDFFPLIGDFDGDSKYDFCLQRSHPTILGQGQFVLLKSQGLGVEFINWGLDSDFLIPGDYDGDGKADFCVRRSNDPSAGLRTHYILTRTGATGAVRWGIAGDISAPGDYDGDGKTDLAVWRPNSDPNQNYFWVLNSNGFTLTQFEWGMCPDIANGDCDFPVAGWAVH